jgi:hypothetical protein
LLSWAGDELDERAYVKAKDSTYKDLEQERSAVMEIAAVETMLTL